MELTSSQIIELINSNVLPNDIKHSFIYWYKKIIRQGEDIRIGPQIITMPFEGMIVFVDLAPHANWAHPCLYLLINIRSLDVKIIEASFPLSIEQSDDNYTIILRFGQILSN
ncbi:hypothetical protein Metho_2696 (plasmid) [Methanomethylovorans hollandica DSM 15978]|jgi:hypothetical protein|uniref:Uncharacterized protein n=1 Tax=Methanomethylovorans hollandica (strain DSM 15978 / NBRC 107637 / DMS1) TaxID=867904 RepID=L0L0H7_METHD|nr:hypothetical protein Metho_2696 [Methanomethylovorans hollandica DSM 15978]